MVGVLFVAFAILLGLALLYHPFRTLSKEDPKKLPHGRMGWPLLGETLAFLKPHKSNSPGTFLQEHCSRYGRVFKSHLFGSKTIVSCDQELNLYILQNEDKLFLVDYPKALHGILGKFSLIMVTGDLHKKLRNVAISFIGAIRASPTFIRCTEKLAVALMESWKGCKEISFFSEAKKFALNMMVKHVLNIEAGDEMALKILEDFETYMKGFTSLPVYIPGTSYAKAVQARARLSLTVKEIMEKRRKKEDSAYPEEDFLDVILSKENLCDEERVSLTLDILLGGYETTATLMALIVYFLSHAPDAFAKLREEHQAIRESKGGEPLDWGDYKKMDFTCNVIFEALRCGNVVKFVHRKAIEDIKFKEYFIPAGWKVLPIFTAVHFDQTLHENPLEFNPWRWAKDKAEVSRKVTPFGGGPRLCPGSDLAKVEIAFFLHHLVLNYRWKTKANDFPMAYPYVEFKRGLLLEIEPTRKIATN